MAVDLRLVRIGVEEGFGCQDSSQELRLELGWDSELFLLLATSCCR